MLLLLLLVPSPNVTILSSYTRYANQMFLKLGCTAFCLWQLPVRPLLLYAVLEYALVVRVALSLDLDGHTHG